MNKEEVQTITHWIDPTVDGLQQENKQLKEEIKKLKMIVYGLNNRDLFPHKICEYIKEIEEELNWEEYLKFQGNCNER